MQRVFKENSWSDYQKQCQRTSSTQPGDEKHRLHLLMGLMGELSEVADQCTKWEQLILKEHEGDIKEVKEQLISEVGDVLWYLALAEVDANVQHPTDDYIFTHPAEQSKLDMKSINVVQAFKSRILSALSTMGMLLDDYKKIYIYGYPTQASFLRSYEYTLSVILYKMSWMCSAYGISLDELCNRNLLKLKKRFPEKFSVENSLNRDYKAESKSAGLKGE